MPGDQPRKVAIINLSMLYELKPIRHVMMKFAEVLVTRGKPDVKANPVLTAMMLPYVLALFWANEKQVIQAYKLGKMATEGTNEQPGFLNRLGVMFGTENAAALKAAWNSIVGDVHDELVRKIKTVLEKLAYDDICFVAFTNELHVKAIFKKLAKVDADFALDPAVVSQTGQLPHLSCQSSMRVYASHGCGDSKAEMLRRLQAELGSAEVSFFSQFAADRTAAAALWGKHCVHNSLRKLTCAPKPSDRYQAFA